MSAQQNRLLWRIVLPLAVLAASLSLSGCLVIPHPRNIALARGIERKKPQLEFLKDGTTTKADVLRELGDFDSDASQERFVWARWKQVKVQTEWFAGSIGGVGGGSVRTWITKNVLAGFDEHDILASHRICSEDELMGCIDAMLDYTSPAEASAALMLPAGRGHGSPEYGRAIFEKGKVAFQHFREPKQNFGLPLSAVDRLTLAGGTSLEMLRVSLQFKPGTQPVEALNLEASPDETIRLARLLHSRPR